MQSIALVVHVLLAIAVIGLVLIQHGKGADAGAAFGSGASATFFGARGSASFLTRATTVLAGAFFVTSLLLFYIAAHRDTAVRSVTDGPSIVDEAPAVPSATDLPDTDDTSALPVTPATDETVAPAEDGALDLPAAGDAAPAATEDLLPAAD